MRSWDKYCEDTEKAFVHFIDCIDQPVYIMGYLYADATDSNQLNPLLCPYWGKWAVVEVPPRRMLCGDYARIVLGSLVVLRAMKRDTVFASTEMQDIHGHIFNYSKRWTGIPNACGMHKPINRLGNAFNWPNVRYRNILPLE